MKIFLTGHSGMVGSAIFKKLNQKYKNNPEVSIYTAKRSELNLLNQQEVENYFEYNKLDFVIDCAAKVGGILSNNTYRANFIYENVQIQNNLIHSSYKTKVKKFLFLGSSCIYPKFAEQPIKEEYLLTSPLEYTNEPYAIAKIVGIKMCESYYKQYGCNFISVMPTNLYGPNDNFHPQNSHVLPGLLHRFHLAKINNEPFVEIWGTGKAKREFMHVDDTAEACIHILNNLDAEDLYSQNISQINIGSGIETTIYELAQKISLIVGYEGLIKFDLSKPDGTMRKLLDCSRLNKLGYSAKIKLEDGLKDTYNWYLNNQDKLKL
jgi:GDP-L-fucose synthase